jgi:hypothetical protein
MSGWDHQKIIGNFRTSPSPEFASIFSRQLQQKFRTASNEIQATNKVDHERTILFLQQLPVPK